MIGEEEEETETEIEETGEIGGKEIEIEIEIGTETEIEIIEEEIGEIEIDEIEVVETVIGHVTDHVTDRVRVKKNTKEVVENRTMTTMVDPRAANHTNVRKNLRETKSETIVASDNIATTMNHLKLHTTKTRKLNKKSHSALGPIRTIRLQQQLVAKKNHNKEINKNAIIHITY